MKYSALPILLRDAFILLSLFSFLFGVASFLLSFFRGKRRYSSFLFSISFTLLSFVLLCLFLRYEEGGEIAGKILDGVPFYLPWSLCLLLFSLLLALVVFLLDERRKGLSLSSYQDAFDEMEMGVCFYDEEGVSLLTNRYIASFSSEYMGEDLYSAPIFLSKLKSGKWKGKEVEEENGTVYLAEDGEAYSLREFELKIEGKKVHEAVLYPITRLYRLAKEKEKSNEKLEQSNAKLRLLGKEIASLRREEENLFARKRIHDDLGGLLIYAQSMLKKELSEEEREEFLSSLEEKARRALDLKEKEEEAPLLQELVKAGKDVGIKVAIRGESQGKEKLIYEAALECLLNAYRHAKAKNMEILISEEGGRDVLRISNDGFPPSGPFALGSGLSALKDLVERKGGEMAIETSPKFVLTIRMKP